jgi:alpha-D-xyloside xylohydrolase
MKFTEGYWRMRPDVTPHFATQVYDVETSADALTVYAPARQIHHRGDTLGVALLTVRFSSPMENVIRVQMTHFKGGKPPKPEFSLYPADPRPVVQIRDEAQAASLTSGSLTVKVQKGDSWRVSFMDGERQITDSAWRNLGVVDTPEGRFAFEQLALGVGESVYGLGERFTPFVKNGQVVDMWNGDGGTSSEIAYKNIPFYLTNRGYGVFVNHPEMVSFEIASEKVERVQFSVPGESLDYFLIYGPTPKEVLQRYTALTGRPALPPAWSFGLWLTTSFVTDYDEDTVTSFIQGMAERGIPLHVFHFDCFWMKGFHWVNFEWDKDMFPDPSAMLRRLKARGLKICVWINPYVAQRSAMFAEGMANGYLIKKPDGTVWQTDAWQSGMGIVDFTNPAACEWYSDKLRALLDMGVDCFKTDFGEVIPTDVVFHDGSDPLKMHNYYTYLYNQTVFRLLEERFGKGGAAVFARSATTGGQQFPVHWGGDSTATFESMAESLRGGLSLGLGGFGFWSHDMGGFELTASSDVYKRWCAFGLLSSHSRLHGNASYRVPWAYGDDDPALPDSAEKVLRYFTRLKCRLMPYLFEAACQAHEQGLPVLRAMLLEFPADPGCDTLDRQYMLGDSLLVAPVFAYNQEVDYYLPAGAWTDILTSQKVQGGGWRKEQHGFLSLPLLARPNSIVPVGKIDDRPDYDYADGVTLQVYELGEGRHAPAIIRNMQGKVDVTFQVSRSGDTITIMRQGSVKPWQVLLAGVPSVAAVEGGTSDATAQGVLIKAAAGSVKITV